MAENKGYSKEEIMGIINDHYLYGQICDVDVVEGGRLDESMTIKEWRERCDLVEDEELLVGYSEFLGVQSDDISRLDKLFQKEGEITLQEFANEISSYTKKVDKNSGEAFYNYVSSKVGFQVNSSSTITEITNRNGPKMVDAITLQYPGFIKTIDEISSKIGRYFMIMIILVFAVGVYGLVMLNTPFLFGGLTIIGLFLFLIQSKLFPTEIQINGASTLGELLETLR